MSEISLGYLVVEAGDEANIENLLKQDPAKLWKSVADAENDAKQLGFKKYSVYEVLARIEKRT
jgi:hypothetical protein